ncbi:flagellar M-ring protein FliF [Legionella israelensis]|uniref:flagellar basal-body MS-ring/collar protein FliF n=1 Tax=Legionella israelensis TaxID=454 RepID=UPI00117C8AA3|nr:flagellar basal-body MS-ring/collar protein FliF [Legionella israelensis]QDP72913.1 flagellar M-ring protein FliF [Legionella israelensis]
MKALIHIQHWFFHLSLKERIIFSSFFIIILFFTLALIGWTIHQPYSVLFKQLDAQDAAQMIEKLEQANISYQLSNEGRDILVKQNEVNQTRLKLMSANLQIKGNIGLELFDQNDFGMTDFSRKINYQRALQGELERTISSLEEVRQARVHLVMPEEHLFQEDMRKPQAAVTLKLDHALSQQQVLSIQRLIAASVPQLNQQDVIIVDQNSNDLTDLDEKDTKNHLMLKKSLEQYLNQKVQKLLVRIFPEHQIAVSVDISINYDELQRESVIPQQEGRITHEKEVRHAIQDKMKKSKWDEDISLEKSVQFGTQKEYFKRASGSIEYISISVALPADTKPQEIQQIEKLIKNTIGFNSQRGDNISVAALIPPPSTKSRNLPRKIVEHKKESRELFLPISGSLLLLCFIVIVLRQIQYRRNRHLLLKDLILWLQEN